jgi:hypothetical protein
MRRADYCAVMSQGNAKVLTLLSERNGLGNSACTVSIGGLKQDTGMQVTPLFFGMVLLRGKLHAANDLAETGTTVP